VAVAQAISTVNPDALAVRSLQDYYS